MSVTTVRLSQSLDDDLDTLARRCRRTKGWLISQAVEQYVEQHRLDEQRWSETLVAMESAAKGNVVAAEKVHEWLRGWGNPDESPAPGAGA